MATPPYQAAYQALIDSLNTAGQVTQTQFQAISEQFTAAQFAQVAEQGQQLSYVQNLDESIRYYQMVNPDCQFALAPSSSGSGIINSNDLPATNSLKNTFTSTVASSSALNILDMVLAMGEVRKPAQTGTQQALAFASKVCLPVQIASVATMLGKQIDGTIYKLATELGLNPPSALDPSTWDGLVSNDDIYGQVFNYLLNLDPATGEMKPYADLDSLAYSALWLKEQGFFENPDESIHDYSPESGISNSTITWLNTNVPNGLAIYTTDKIIFSFKGFSSSTQPNRFFGVVTSRPVKICPYIHRNNSRNEDKLMGAIADEGVFMYKTAMSYTSLEDLETKLNNASYTTATAKTLNGLSYYYSEAMQFGYWYQFVSSSPELSNNNKFANSSYDEINQSQLAYLILTRAEGGVSIPGVEDNGGMLPDTSTWTDVQAVKDSILAQYPDIDADPIIVDTVQPDGSTKQYTYVPVTLPGDIDPLGNPDTQNIPATDVSVNPETATDPQLQMMIQLLTQLSPLLNPEPSPETDPDSPGNDGSNEDNPDYPGSNDIGTGIAPLPIVPTGTASALWTVYNPSQSELDSFGGWLWSPAFIDNILKLFSNPMDAIIGVHKVFAPVPSGSHKNIKCGFLDSGVSAATVNTQYIDVDCGTVNLYEYFGNVFDYDPNTKVSIYLPFIGVVPLKTAEVMRASINVTYGIDLYTGACLAKIRVNRDGGAGGILYSFGGSCACYYPLSGGSYSGIISGIVSSAVGIGGALMSGNPLGAIGALAGGLSRSHTDVQHTGGFTGPSGVMGPKSPYLIVIRPQAKMANDYPHYDGIPANSTETIGNCHGYTKCKEVHLYIPGAYYNELQEIENLLKSGVII